jgi:hypothetical protein
MELAMPTFVWLRDLGCIATNHATNATQKGMIGINTAGCMQLQQGKGIVRLLQHYCCSRFDTPEVLQPKDGDDTTSKRHNWSIVNKLLKDALDYDLAWERRELIIAGDVIETMVLLKQIHELVKPHRILDEREKEQHRLMNEKRLLLEEESLLRRPIVLNPKRTASPIIPKGDYEKPWLTHARLGSPQREKEELPLRRKLKPDLPAAAKSVHRNRAADEEHSSGSGNGGGRRSAQKIEL